MESNPEKAQPATVETVKPKAHKEKRSNAEHRIRQLVTENRDLKRELGRVRADLAELTAEVLVEEERRKQLRNEAGQEFAAAVTEMRRGYPDFDAVLSALAAMPAELLDEIKDNPGGPVFLYLLGKNPALYHGLCSLPPRVAKHEIRRRCLELAKVQEQRNQERRATEMYYESIHLETLNPQ